MKVETQWSFDWRVMEITWWERLYARARHWLRVPHDRAAMAELRGYLRAMRWLRLRQRRRDECGAGRPGSEMVERRTGGRRRKEVGMQ